MCHPSSSTPIVSEGQNSTVSQPTTRSRIGILNYNPTHGSTSVTKYVMNDHVVDVERYKKVVAAIDAKEKKYEYKKRKHVNPSATIEYYGRLALMGRMM